MVNWGCFPSVTDINYSTKSTTSGAVYVSSPTPLHLMKSFFAFQTCNTFQTMLLRGQFRAFSASFHHLGLGTFVVLGCHGDGKARIVPRFCLKLFSFLPLLFYSKYSLVLLVPGCFWPWAHKSWYFWLKAGFQLPESHGESGAAILKWRHNMSRKLII